jgi:16S rRNA (uracil1498-N3)-methyltransferase
MPHHRFFADDLQHATVTLREKEFHHLKHVMRLELQEEVELIDGRGHLAAGVITHICRQSATVEITALHAEPKPRPMRYLAIPYLKPANSDLVIEKGTELGIDTFIFFPCERSEESLRNSLKIERLQHLLISAIKQCGRLYLPETIFLHRLEDLQTLQIPLYFCHLDQGLNRLSIPIHDPTCLVIGPEKGWSAKEVGLLKNQIKATPITLGPTILRAETAAIAAAALMCY